MKKYFYFLISLLVLFSGFLGNSRALAQDVGIEAVVDRNEVALGESLRLTITITGTTNVDELDINALADFDIRYLGPRTNVTVINGKYSSAKSFVYTLFPKRTGEFMIEPLSFTIKGATYSSKPISIKVVDSSQVSGSTSAQNTSSATTSISDNLYVVVQTAKNEVFINEAVPVKILLFATGVDVRDIRFPEIEQLGFTMDDFKKPRQGQQVINGKRYDIIEFNAVVYPTRTGEISLGPAFVECNVVYRRGASSSSFGGSVFDDDFFDGFFNRVEKQPMRLQSNQITLKVSDLPQENRPSDFSNAVGEFEFQASASPKKVRVGDPITFRMNVQGSGNLAAVDFPKIKDEGFKQYDPIIKEENGIKVYEQVLIPTSKDIKQIPSVQFSYFDPALKKYRTISQGPFDVTVEEGEGGVDFFSSADNDVESKQTELVGEDIIFIKERPGRLVFKSIPLYQNPLFYFILFGIGAFWGAGIVWIKRQERFRLDPSFRNKSLAARNAKSELKDLQARVHGDKGKNVHDTVYKILQRYFSAKSEIPLGRINAQNVEKYLLEEKVDLNVIERIKVIFAECEQVRYAAGAKTKNTSQNLCSDVEGIINQLEKTLK